MRRRVMLIVLGILVALPVAGALYQAACVRSESSRFPPPGRLIRVDGERRLHLVCVGQGDPTVIFEPSGFGGALSASVAREEIGVHTRVCSYDRMGMGWSDPGPGTISMGLLADDLERLTQAAGLRPPFILAPASIGGLVAELFTRRHPEQVAGLVFLDAANSDIIARIAPRITWKHVAGACLVKTAARLGVLRLLDPFGVGGNPADVAHLYRVEPAATVCGVARGLEATLREFAAAPPLSPDLPLTVLVHERPDRLLPPGLGAERQMVEREWLPLQQRFAQRSARGTWRVVPGSDHLIGHSQPHAVAGAVIEMLGR